jgi:hypothetical protein
MLNTLMASTPTMDTGTKRIEPGDEMGTPRNALLEAIRGAKGKPTGKKRVPIPRRPLPATAPDPKVRSFFSFIVHEFEPSSHLSPFDCRLCRRCYT